MTLMIIVFDIAIIHLLMYSYMMHVIQVLYLL